MSLGLERLLPADRGYVQGTLGLNQDGATLRGEGGWKFRRRRDMAAFAFGEAQRGWDGVTSWDAGLGWKWNVF